MHPPREWTERWAREHPKQAIAVLLFGVLQLGFVVWILWSDGWHW